MGTRLDLRLFKSPDGAINCGLELEKTSTKITGHIRCGTPTQTIADLVKETVQDVISAHGHLFVNGLDISAEDLRLRTT